MVSLWQHPGQKLIGYSVLQEEEHDERKAPKAILLVKLMTNNDKKIWIGGYDAIRRTKQIISTKRT